VRQLITGHRVLCLSSVRPGRVSDHTTDRIEARESPRRRTLLSGVLVHGPACLTTDCSVRDLSDTGAQVRMLTVGFLARPAALLVPKVDRAWEVAVARLRGASFGLSFLREIDLRGDGGEEPDFTVRRIWRSRGGVYPRRGPQRGRCLAQPQARADAPKGGRRCIVRGPARADELQYCPSVAMDSLSPPTVARLLELAAFPPVGGKWKPWRKCAGGRRRPNDARSRPPTASNAKPSSRSPSSGGG